MKPDTSSQFYENNVRHLRSYPPTSTAPIVRSFAESLIKCHLMDTLASILP